MTTATTRCKLILVSKSEPTQAALPMVGLSFSAQYNARKSEEDAIFGLYTPAANFNASITADHAEKLVVGKAYYFDISEVPEDETPAAE